MVETVSAEIVVIGAGPAGIAAATRAAEAGRPVVLLDQAEAPGGQVWKHGSAVGLPHRARRWLSRLRLSGTRRIAGAEVVAAPTYGRLVVDRPGSPLEVRYDRLVIATGARERFLPFPGWTLPGVIGVGAAQALLKSGASFHGRRGVLAGSGPLLLPAAAGLSSAGARVALVAEQAPGHAVRGFARRLASSPGKLVEAARYRWSFRSAPYRTGVWVSAARGDDRVREAVLTDGERSWIEACDLLCCAYGLVPNLELPLLLGCDVSRGRAAVSELLETSRPGIFCAGEVTGIGGVDLALVEGEIAGLAAAGLAGETRPLLPERRRALEFAAALDRAFALRDELTRLPSADTIVCRCEDVSFGQLERAWTRRQAKLYSRIGMGACQGRVCGPAVEFLFGWERDSVRPPMTPVPFSTLLAMGEDEEGS